ncbi:MAG: hypothetical protein U9R24_04540, partial [Thermodesulfobacteriota bacterium]|nr:hypothetical protein [Thermodesulfobacteriota bacterium]
MKKRPVIEKTSGLRLVHSIPDISWQRGSILIGLIVIMVIFSILAVALLPMFSTSTMHQVKADQALRAHYLAESGYRYAASEFLHGGTGEDWDDVLNVLNGKEYIFSGNNSAFEIDIEAYFYKFKQLSGNTLETETFGDLPDTIPTSGTGVSGTVVVFEDTTFYHQFSGYSVEAGGTEVNFSLTGGTPAGTRVFPAVTGSGTQTMTKGSNISFTGTGVLFPLRYGAFRVYDSDGNEKDSAIFAYDEIDTSINQLKGIKDMMNPGNSFSVDIDPGDYMVLQRFINFTSTGKFGDLDSSYASKTLTYAVPMEAIKTSGTGGTEEIGGDEMLEALADSSGPGGLGEFEVQEVGGDNALAVTKTTGGSGNQPRVEAIVGLPEGEDNPFYTAWSSRGEFLNYDAQVKIAEGIPDAGGVFSDKPDYYLVGLSFRYTGNTPGELESYGLSFMRSRTGTGQDSDGIPDDLVPGYIKNGPVSPYVDTPMIILWDRGGRGLAGGDEWMAYMELSPDNPVLDQPLAGNDQGAWAPVTGYDVDDVVTHNSVKYICIVAHTS